MSIIKFRPYKNLSDKELLDSTINTIKRLRSLFKEQNQNEYLDEVNRVNEMIIEVKRRNLKLDDETLLKKILTTYL